MRKGYSLAGSLLISLLLWAGVVQASEDVVELKGELKQGSMMVGKTEPGFQVSFNGEQLEVADNGYFVFGFPREADTEHELVITDAEGKTHKQSLEIASREYNIQRIDGLPQQTVTPDPAAQKRQRAEAALVWKARQTRSDMTYFASDFIWPAQGRISGVYGSQRILNGEPRNPHWGHDIAAPTGTPVVAPASGVVVLVHPDMLMSGGTLIIDHGHGVFSTYIHLHRVLVEEGNYISQGDPIAEIGASGRATGPHLDWRLNWRDMRLDPALLLPPRD
jgi:murein DD-endopeptidase MepM/ murein hydrolase activator NlpD